MEIMPNCALHLTDQVMHDMITFNKTSKKQIDFRTSGNSQRKERIL